jgi:hypothetical protein
VELLKKITQNERSTFAAIAHHGHSRICSRVNPPSHLNGARLAWKTALAASARQTIFAALASPGPKLPALPWTVARRIVNERHERAAIAHDNIARSIVSARLVSSAHPKSLPVPPTLRDADPVIMRRLLTGIAQSLDMCARHA